MSIEVTTRKVRDREYHLTAPYLRDPIPVTDCAGKPEWLLRGMDPADGMFVRFFSAQQFRTLEDAVEYVRKAAERARDAGRPADPDREDAGVTYTGHGANTHAPAGN